MGKRTDLKSILILGAGPIVIGQACEFDYSGAQACKALREEGYRVILVNSNPATIMTDPEMADATYIEPIHWEVVEKIIEQEINSEKPIFIDEDALIAFEDKLEIKTISRGVKELITSGEGFLFSISGKGKVWIQTREKGEYSSSGGVIDGIFDFMK